MQSFVESAETITTPIFVLAEQMCAFLLAICPYIYKKIPTKPSLNLSFYSKSTPTNSYFIT